MTSCWLSNNVAKSSSNHLFDRRCYVGTEWVWAEIAVIGSHLVAFAAADITDLLSSRENGSFRGQGRC